MLDSKLKEKVRNPAYMIYTLVVPSVLGLALGIMFLIIGLTYDDMEQGLDIVFFVSSGMAFFFFIMYSLVCPVLIRIYPKHKKLTHIFLQEYMFKK